MKVMSTIASYSPLNISETVTDTGLVPNDHRHEMAYGESNGHGPMTSRDPKRSNSWPEYAYSPTSSGDAIWKQSL